MLYECGGGVNSFAIDPYGDMTICVLSHQDKYNVRNGSIRDGWQHFLYGVRTRPKARRTKCTDCAMKSLCGSCAATNELENGGDPEAPVDFLCRTAHLRAEIFGVAVPAHGECEYCQDGSHYEDIREMAKEVRDETMGILETPVPVVTSDRAACGTGGCGSCHIL
jgi:radical SAM protein with 4Fe4S-binding SPASM domain